jgi:hypothetical protein
MSNFQGRCPSVQHDKRTSSKPRACAAAAAAAAAALWTKVCCTLADSWSLHGLISYTQRIADGCCMLQAYLRQSSSPEVPAGIVRVLVGLSLSSHGHARLGLQQQIVSLKILEL